MGYVSRPTVAFEKEKPRLLDTEGVSEARVCRNPYFTAMKRDNAKKLLDAVGTAALVGFAGGVAKALAELLITYLAQ
ncbi:MAG: hypothetical protein EOO62_25000 [Hymenobacter sp.]|nr:MAG: hypothetical protein EOO62_25000 [Hymenobacter sp.]